MATQKSAAGNKTSSKKAVSDTPSKSEDVKVSPVRKKSASSKSDPDQAITQTATDTWKSAVDRVSYLKTLFDQVSGGEPAQVGIGSSLHLAVLEISHVGSSQEVLAKQSARLEKALKACGDINAENEFLETPLHWAVVARATHCVDWLIARGANVNATSPWGTPLHYDTASGGNFYFAKSLLNSGSDPKILNKQRRLAVSFVDSTLKKYFEQHAEDAQIERLARRFEEGELPTLPSHEIREAISGALDRHVFKYAHQNDPADFLRTVSSAIRSGSPSCRTCDQSFGSGIAYARHMMSIEHMAAQNGTTPGAILQAQAFLTANGIYHCNNRHLEIIDTAIASYPKLLDKKSRLGS